MSEQHFLSIGRHRGFTLIELLVVISIISLLVAILMPALSVARASAQTVSCLSNVRQLMIANHIYAGDFKGYLAPAKGGTRYQPQYYWFSTLTRGNYLAAQGLVCPSDTQPNDWATVLYDWKQLMGSDNDLPVSYGYSETLGNHHKTLSPGGKWTRLAQPKRIGDFTGARGPHSDPARAFVVFDYANTDWQPGAPVENAKVGGDIRYGMARVSARHGAAGADIRGEHVPQQGDGNFGFVDGHAATLQAPFSMTKYVLNPEFHAKYRAAGGFTADDGGY